jgi:predicted GNAT family acetyltransferase
MKPEFAALPLIKNEKENAYEVMVDGHKAFSNYYETQHQITIIHTEVDPALEGRGVGTALIEKILAVVDASGKKLVPLCPFTFAYIRRHREWKRLVDPRFAGYDTI